MIAGAIPEQDDVIVIVDKAGHGRAPAQVDLARARTEALVLARPDGREAAILNRDLGDGRPSRVHRHDLAVGKSQVARTRAGIDLSRLTAGAD